MNDAQRLHPEPMTADLAIENACRLLRDAELQSDQGLLKRWGLLADSWISIANLLNDRE